MAEPLLSRRGRTFVIIAAMVLVLLLILLMRSRPAADDGRDTRADDELDTPARAASDHTPASGKGGAKLPPAKTLPPAEAPIIDEVIVEKQEVCRGEENLITVRAHTPGGADDAHLHYMVVSTTGGSAPVRLQSRDEEKTDGVQRQIIAFGRDGTMTTVDLPEYAIKDCDEERRLMVTHGLLPNSENEFRFSARIQRIVGEDDGKTPVLYRWTFGDGTTQDTEFPVVEHDFGGRREDSYYSHFLIACEAMYADGTSVLGRESLQLMNPAFEELYYKGMVRMTTLLTPRFPEMAADGTVTQTVRLWHARPEAVTVTRVLRAVNRHGVPQGGPEVASAVELLGTSVVPPGPGLTFKVRLDTNADPDVYSIDYLIEGESVEGWPAHGNFSLMRPPDLPTRENSEPVTSPYMKAKIMRAQELLGKKYVTDEDIWQLEREGKMDDIRPENYPPTESAPPERPPAGVRPN